MNIIEATKLMHFQKIFCKRKNKIGMLIQSEYKVIKHVYELYGGEIDECEDHIPCLFNNGEPYAPEIDDILAEDWEIVE